MNIKTGGDLVCLPNHLFKAYHFYKEPDTLRVPYIMFLMLQDNIMRSTYVEIWLEQMVCLEEVIW